MCGGVYIAAAAGWFFKLSTIGCTHPTAGISRDREVASCEQLVLWL